MNTYDYTAAVEMEATDYQKIASFGFELAEFLRDNPDVDCVWQEVEDGKPYGKGTTGVVFVVHFQTIDHRDLYRAHRNEDEEYEIEVESPIVEIMTRLRRTPMYRGVAG